MILVTGPSPNATEFEWARVLRRLKGLPFLWSGVEPRRLGFSLQTQKNNDMVLQYNCLPSQRRS